MTRVIVCTFATAEYAGSAEVLRHSALRHGADAVVVYREADVKPWFAAHPELSSSSRAFGYYSWKPWCIRQTLFNHAAPGDVVIWCDAGMAFEDSLTRYVAAALADPAKAVLLFRLGGWATSDYTNRKWTTPRALAAMGVTHTQTDAVQLNAAIQLWVHAPAAFRVLDDYVRWCGVHDVVADDPLATGIQDHRHDQSVLSLLAAGPHASAVTIARDPTQHGVNDPLRATGVLTVAETPLVDHHRRCLRPPRVAVITPTIGTQYLAACVASVQAQTLPNVVQYLVVDGPDHAHAVEAVAQTHAGRMPIHTVQLPHNVGAGGWNGHR
jgi:hypothetical protein